MRPDFFETLKRYLGFTEDDVVNLGKMVPFLQPAFPAVIDRFYGQVLRDSVAVRVFTRANAQLENQKRLLTDWLADLFTSKFGQDYFERRSRIGWAHVKVRMPPYLMVSGMAVVRTELTRALCAAGPPDEHAWLVSLNKALDLDLAIMIETYSENVEREIRQTERDQFEAKLGESEHLAELGKLAASLAHEIKNPLAGISGAIQVLGHGIGADDERQEVIQEILRQVDRLDSAVKDLLVYARPVPPVPEQRDLAAILTRVLKLLEASPALKKVSVRCHGLERHPYALVDERQIEQVFYNLVINACHACSAGDRLDIIFEPNEMFTTVRIEDRGKGMTPDVLDRAFEPFYTTKARGTGLGLPICKRIIEAHRGTIELTSRPGQGTTVTLCLPARTDGRKDSEESLSCNEPESSSSKTKN